MWSIWSNLKVSVVMAGLTALLGALGQALGGRTGLVVALAPLAAFGSARVVRWFSTHPSTDERIARLERLAGSTLWRAA